MQNLLKAGLIFLLSLLPKLWMTALWADEELAWSIAIERDKDVIEIESSIVLGSVAPEMAWTVLTDYDQIASYTSRLVLSEIVGQTDDGKRLIHQVSRDKWSVFSKKMEITMAVEETHLQQIQFEAISGDFEFHSGFWKIEPLDAGCRVHFHSKSKPKDKLPVLVGGRILRRATEETLDAISNEMLRRSADIVARK
jgi:ribosome-associated toxin RatA of RatAB toxin-antitoxin module